MNTQSWLSLRIWILTLALSSAAARGAAPTTLPVRTDEIPGGIKIEMVRIPAGSVDVLPPGEANPKTVPVKSIWFGRTELTWDAYDVWLLSRDLSQSEQDALVLKEQEMPKHARSRPSLPYALVDGGFGHENRPVICLHSHAAEMYCKWLSAKTGRKYRLPTETEWEYACRAGGDAVPPDPTALDKMAWHYGTSQNETGDCTTHPVGSKAPNAWGLYDMLGNAAEWVAGFDGKPVLKGGSYKDKPKGLSARWRAPFNPDWQMTDPEDPKSAWWLRDGQFAGMRIVCEE